MSSAPTKTIAVVGGTGNLGSSVAYSLRENPDFHVRVLSRDPASDKAKKISDAGIEVVKADTWERGELLKAFKGCWGVFINIDSDAPNFKQQIGPSEYEMGKIVIDSAVEAGISHAVHASLPASTKLTNGKVSVLAFDDKARISDYMLQEGKFGTATVVSAGWFLSNAFDPKYCAAFGGFAMLPDSEGYLTWETPSMGNSPESVPWLAVADDYGDFVHGVFLYPERWHGKYVHGVSESMSFADMVHKFQDVTGKPTRYRELPLGGLKATNPPKTKEVNLLYDLMHALQGNFFNGVPTNHEDARTLKAEAAKARKSSAVSTTTVEQFWKKYAGYGA